MCAHEKRPADYGRLRHISVLFQHITFGAWVLLSTNRILCVFAQPQNDDTILRQ